MQEIIFNSILNKWAFWLDDIGTMMNNKNNKIYIIESLEKFINQLDSINNLDDTVKDLVSEPTQLIKLAKWYIKNKELQSSISTFRYKLLKMNQNFVKQHIIIKLIVLLNIQH